MPPPRTGDLSASLAILGLLVERPDTVANEGRASRAADSLKGVWGQRACGEHGGMNTRSARSGILGVLIGGGLLGGLAGPASAFAASPWWHLTSGSRPTEVQPGGSGQIVVTASNLGDADANGGSEPVKITDKLPAGLSATGVEGFVEEEKPGGGSERIALTCSSMPLQCSYAGILAPYRQLQVLIDVDAEPGASSGEVNEATVSGGEAPGVSASRGVLIGGGMPFGLEAYEMGAEEQGGGPDTQAGSHPFQLTTALTFDQTGEPGKPPALAKDLRLDLPAGLIANPTPFPQCTLTRFVTSSGGVDECPAQTALGVASVTVDDPADSGPVTLTVPVFSLEPAVGEPARFGFDVEGVLVMLDASVRSGMDYGITLSASNISQTMTLIGATLTFWGVPGDPRHDNSRGWSCVDDERYRAIDGSLPSCVPLGEAHPPPFVTLPTSCAAALDSTLSADSWAAPGVSAEASSMTAPLTGCNRLPFDPSISIAPDVSAADTSSGYELDLDVPQPEDPEGLASAALKEAAVTLPEGVGISLSAADGLRACTEAQVGLSSPAAVTCPNASKIGTVAIRTPLLANPLQGAVYLATPSENPFASPLAVYISVVDPVTGVTIKLAGEIEANQLTGQLMIVLRELPQLPISALELHFFGGERALLSTPPMCGVATSTSALTPWSGAPAVAPSSSFEIDMEMDGTACSAAQPFDPTLQMGSTTAGEADTYGSLSLFVSRTAQEQQLGAISIQAPPAVAQLFADVPACGEPQASEGACPTASEVGTVAAQAGLGSYPADLNGEIYLTGPYGGAAQGLEIVMPVEPGPFELGNVVVRASVQIETGTGRLSIATGPLPSFADGAPLQFKTLLLKLDRGEFRISPDGCESLIVTGTISSAQGSSVTIATEPFGVASSSCPPQAVIPPAVTTEAGGVTGSVSLASTRIATTWGGETAVKLRCTGADTCRGKLTLTVQVRGKSGKRRSKTTAIGTATFSILPGKTATIKLELNAVGRALLSAAHGRLSATLMVLKSSPAPSQTRTENVQLVQKSTKAKKPTRFDGYSYEQVGEQLSCDTKAVDNALQRVKRKVGAHLQARAVAA